MKRIGLFFLLLLVAGNFGLIFFGIPATAEMGFVQKIMYIHVPSIWNAFLSFFVAFICSLIYLWKRWESSDIIAGASVEIGVVFCAITLFSGSVWARPTWNTYWTWDARLTTTLILFLIFVGYILLRRFSTAGEQQARLAAVVAIVGFLDIPLIHMSVVWWRTLHQPTTFFSSRSNVIDHQLALTLWISVFTFTFIYLFLLYWRIQLEKKHRSYLRAVANLY
jgi:heme exporter protein C